MPANPFPLGGPWGRKLDRMYREDRAAERFRRECARTVYGMRPARRAGVGR